MKTLARRRNRNVLLMVLCGLGIVFASIVAQIAVAPLTHATGWLLLVMIVFLAAYNARKRVPFLPLLKSSTWLQLHIYVGLLTALIFGIHLSFRLPNGLFESVLALLYLAVFASGVAGLFLSRTIPARLTGRGEEVLFERIPVHTRQLRESAEKLVFECINQTETNSIPDLYLGRLQDYFSGPRNLLRHLFRSDRPLRELQLEMQSQKRFMNEPERSVVDRLSVLVEQKDDLDYHYAMQSVLKIWLFVHVPLTYALLVFACFHTVVVSSFAGGW